MVSTETGTRHTTHIDRMNLNLSVLPLVPYLAQRRGWFDFLLFSFTRSRYVRSIACFSLTHTEIGRVGFMGERRIQRWYGGG